MQKSSKNEYQREKEIPTDTPLNPGAMFINNKYHPYSSSYDESEEWTKDHDNHNSGEDSTEQVNDPS